MTKPALVAEDLVLRTATELAEIDHLRQALNAWLVENKNHWKRDTSQWKEDASRPRKKASGGQVLALLRGPSCGFSTRKPSTLSMPASTITLPNSTPPCASSKHPRQKSTDQTIALGFDTFFTVSARMFTTGSRRTVAPWGRSNHHHDRPHLYHRNPRLLRHWRALRRLLRIPLNPANPWKPSSSASSPFCSSATSPSPCFTRKNSDPSPCTRTTGCNWPFSSASSP